VSGRPEAEVLGVLGGGQLARMLALAAAPLGVRTRVLDPNPAACAADVADHVHADYDDSAALERFARGLAAATYEFENVPAHAADALAALAPLRPGAASLRAAADRVAEKHALVDAGFEVAPWAQADDHADLPNALDHVGTPCLIKARTGGYDGKGQARVHSPEQAAEAFDAIGRRPVILERLIPFDRELSIVAVAAHTGERAFYPLAQNHHAGGILRHTIAPAPEQAGVAAQARSHAAALADNLGHVGVITVELFQVGGRLIANEFAPRVHNSGHWTIDAARTSQFENHVRAVLGLPLGQTDARSPAVMLNCIGRMPPRDRVLAYPGARLHDYAKRQRPGRKVGHVTIPLENGPQADAAALAPNLAPTLAAELGAELGLEGGVGP